MTAKKMLVASLLFVLAGLVSGCHHGVYDDHRDYGYGYGSSSGSYRDGFRDGRTYERRRDAWNDRYSSDSWRRR
jgi:hypothetical protein